MGSVLTTLVNVIREVAVIVLLAGLLEMLLPENGIRRYVKVVMGLFIMVTLLVPLISFLSAEEDWSIGVWQLPAETPMPIDSVFRVGQSISTDIQKTTSEAYEKRLAQQIEAMVLLVPGVASVQAQIQLKPNQTGDSLMAPEKVILAIQVDGGEEDGNSNSIPNEEIAENMQIDQNLEAHLNQESVINNPTESEETVPVEPIAPIKITDQNPDPEQEQAKGADYSAEKGKTNPAQQAKIAKQAKEVVANFYGVPQNSISVVFS